MLNVAVSNFRQEDMSDREEPIALCYQTAASEHLQSGQANVSAYWLSTGKVLQAR